MADGDYKFVTNGNNPILYFSLIWEGVLEKTIVLNASTITTAIIQQIVVGQLEKNKRKIEFINLRRKMSKKFAFFGIRLMNRRREIWRNNSEFTKR